MARLTSIRRTAHRIKLIYNKFACQPYRAAASMVGSWKNPGPSRLVPQAFDGCGAWMVGTAAASNSDMPLD
jgi:hypothetical protein